MIACLTEHHPSEFPLPSVGGGGGGGGGYGYFMEQHNGPLKFIKFYIGSRLCSKKNWREPIALNLWNLRRPASDFFKKTKISLSPGKKIRH